MNNASVVGIDVSKQYFDAAWAVENGQCEQRRFRQDVEGFAELVRLTPEGSVYVMEATGVYYLRLAHYLHAAGVRVAVINPLVIRRYGQMKLLRAKTDRVDAQLIASYGQTGSFALWQPAENAISQLQQLQSWLEGLLQEQTRLKNQQEAWRQRPEASAFVGAAQAQRLEQLQDQIHACEQEMQQWVQRHYAGVYQRLISIPGVGPKTAIQLIAVTDGFRRFDRVEALVSYVGLCPRVYTSGSSVRGSHHITKLGMGRMRQLLYLCSWTAQRCNQACARLHARLKAKGKPERVIKIAIAHKLLRQAFAVAMKHEMYSETCT